MKRREFITVLGGAVATWPLGVRAQQQPVPVIGFLSAISSYGPFLVAFRNGLAEAGYIEGENVAIEYLWAEGRYDQLPELASELVRRQVAAIVAVGGNESARAAKAATTTIPIVFYSGDPVAEGLVSSLNRPGGNLTGMSTFAPALGGKRIDLLRELLHGASALAMLINPKYAPAAAEAAETENAARALGHRLSVFKASSESGIEAAFATLAQQRPDALIVGADPSSIVDASRSPRWPCVVRSRRFTYGANLSWLAA
jgi:putative tryptophan/tyrosine transport system substrate-binding protein